MQPPMETGETTNPQVDLAAAAAAAAADSGFTP